MKNVFSNILECIGNTPLIRINRLNENPRVTLYAKWEARNPGGSIKDRPALFMIERAERDGSLTRGRIIIEATSGNTGIGLAVVAAVKGYRLMLAMPETASLERQKILKALGAELLLTPGSMGTDGAIEEVYRLVREDPDRYFMPDQFNNPANPSAHQFGTGPEIYEQTDGQVNAVVVTLGTSGTAMGILRAMKERSPTIEVIAVEPYSGHKIQGLKNMKESYVPGIFDRYALDRIVHVRDEDAFEMARRLAREEGIFAGMSSGAAMAAAVQVAAERQDGIVVTVLPDGGDRYLSTNLFTTMLEPDFSFFDMLHRAKVELKPIQEGKVSIFLTGPPLDQSLTVQEARRFLLADLLSRFLQYKGFKVSQVVLAPDMDSRAIQGALAARLDLQAYTQRQMDLILEELDRLGLQRAYRYPRTSEHIDIIENNTRSLINKGVAYEKLRSVYCDLSKSRGYGALSNVDLKKIRLGTTVDLDAYEKLNPRDFTLLKRATLAELKHGMCMKTDWGNVIPTLHIAAASVAIHHLGSPFDIHISSVDFLFPHLENMKAIGEALTGKPLANVWMVCERVWAGREAKAAHDLDDMTPIRDLIASGFSYQEIRFWLLFTHYRKTIHISRKDIENAVRGYRRLAELVGRVQHLPCSGQASSSIPEMIFSLEQSFFDALADDLNMPRALAALYRFVRQVHPVLDKAEFDESQRSQMLASLERLNGILGVFDLGLKGLTEEEQSLVEQREAARAAKDWERADHLREELRRQGIRLLDTPCGTRWERVP
ncbi:MAG: cysteine synthase [Syntrophobacteraceae bacterium]|jgi:cysteinyl-tRNA synthetase|nr:cysteine synthase [Syntrophobacteraceae bacterium]